MRLWIPLVTATALASCQFNPNTVAGADDADPNVPDADPNAPDADPSAPDAAPNQPDANKPDATPVCVDWGYDPIHLDECAIEQPTGSLLLDLPGTYIYNTDNGVLMGPGAISLGAPTSEVLTLLDPDARVIIVDRLEISSGTTLRVIGAMPLIVVSWNDIAIQGTLNVNSSRGALPGAGANPATCGTPAATPGTGNPGIGRGGGGGGALGGDGGDGGSDGNPDGDKGKKISTPDNIRGGCSGGIGGGGTGALGNPGVGGPGGGAVYLVAQNSILVTGIMKAAGGGGQGARLSATPRPAGGGGGSGGYLGLEAPTVTLHADAVLAANGGGGGGGTDFVQAGSGENGPAADSPRAPGGIGVQGGTDGGDGGIQGNVNGTNGANVNDRGNGGGGGGVGFILVNSPSFDKLGATVSPTEILTAP